MSVKCFFIYVCGLLWWFFRLKMYFVFCLGLIIFEYFWWFSIVWSFFLVNRGFWFKKEILVYLEKLVIYVNVFFVLVDVFIGYLWMGFYIDKKMYLLKWIWFVLIFCMRGFLSIVLMFWYGLVMMLLLLFLKNCLFYRIDMVGFIILWLIVEF